MKTNVPFLLATAGMLLIFNNQASALTLSDQMESTETITDPLPVCSDFLYPITAANASIDTISLDSASTSGTISNGSYSIPLTVTPLVGTNRLIASRYTASDGSTSTQILWMVNVSHSSDRTDIISPLTADAPEVRQHTVISTKGTFNSSRLGQELQLNNTLTLYIWHDTFVRQPTEIQPGATIPAASWSCTYHTRVVGKLINPTWMVSKPMEADNSWISILKSKLRTIVSPSPSSKNVRRKLVSIGVRG